MNLAAKEGRVPVRSGSISTNGSVSEELTQREKDLLMKFVRLMQGRIGGQPRNVKCLSR